MLFYISLIFLLFVYFILSDYSWKNKWLKNILLISPCLLLFFISIFRFDVGFDYPNYYRLVGPSFDRLEFERIEPIAQLLVLIARYFREPWLLFVLFGIPIYILAFWTCYKTKHFQLAFWTYLSLFYLDTLSTIRQAAAASIIMCGIIFIQKKRFFQYLLICVVASLFHSSSLIMLPVYFIYHYCSWKNVLICMSLFTCFFNVFFSILIENDLYASYLKSENEMEGGALLRYFYVFLYVFLLVLSYKKQLIKETKRLFTALLPGFFFPFLFGGHLGGRISSYFYLIFLFLIPQILSKCGEKVKILFMLMLVAFFFAILYMSQKQIKSPFTPYQSIFEVDLRHPKFK